ncbi:HJR/Mrr/RecB family endonuclease [Pseudomonas sp. ADAK2 TE3594]
METHNLQLSNWQQDFVTKFVASTSPRNILIAGVGLGKTVTSIRAASEKLKTGQAKKVAFLSDRQVLRDQWAYMAKAGAINIAHNVLSFTNGSDNGTSITYQSLSNAENFDPLMTQASRGGLLIIADEVDRYKKSAIDLSNRILEASTSNQVLFISRSPLISQPEDWQYEFGKEFIFEPKTLLLPSNKVLLIEYSPSLGVLSKLQNQTHTIDDLSWRQFEMLISELLESDGYEIELMSGTKDGGVDIVAVKDLGESGMFKALWQAKKYSSSRKIGISTIRELADVRNEHKASKGVIVTSSFLTSGAMQRIERDKFILGKVDGDDLRSWIERKLYS